MATTALAGAALVGAAPNAFAVPAFAAELGLGTSFDDNGPVTCTVTSGGEANSTSTVATGVAKTKTISGAATISDSADVADVTTMQASATITAKFTTAAGSLATYEFRGRARASLDPAQGSASDCDAESSVLAQMNTQFTITRPGWLDVDVTKSDGGAIATIAGSSDGAFQEVVIGPRTHSTRTVFLPTAGVYVILTQFGVGVSASGVRSDSATGVATAVFTPAGGASGPARGAGKRYLKPAAGRGCGSGTLTAKWTGRAGKVVSAEVFVNQRKVKTVRNPKPGKSVVLGGLAAGKAVDLVVVSRLKSGKKVDLSRSYRACQ